MTKWLAPADDDTEKWILMFDDADRGMMIFHGEHEARRQFEIAEQSWSVYLFKSVAREP